MDAALQVLSYLKGTPGQGILLPAIGGLSLEVFCDSDWGGCPMTQRSRTGYFISLGGAPISWRTKKQTMVSRSSTEAEYCAMTATVSEVLWLRWLLIKLGHDKYSPHLFIAIIKQRTISPVILFFTREQNMLRWIVTLSVNVLSPKMLILKKLQLPNRLQTSLLKLLGLISFGY